MAESSEGNNSIKVNKNDYIVFEVCTEVPKKVGGIHSVIKTKANSNIENTSLDYFLIGVLNEDYMEEIEVTEADTTTSYALECMRTDGYKAVHGRWLIEGHPKVILLDIESGMKHLDAFKSKFWNDCYIAIPRGNKEGNEALVFGSLTFLFLQKYRQKTAANIGMVVQFHEWLSGVGLILCRTQGLHVATVFTTHATQLGRHLCASRTDFYGNINKFAAEEEASVRQIYQKYCIEKVCAKVSHVFSIVSSNLKVEVEHFLNKTPDIVLPNGLNINPDENLVEKHNKSNQIIQEFILNHFPGQLKSDQTVIMFSAGRYEFFNKGIDMLIEALGQLNVKLAHLENLAKGTRINVVFFLIFPADHGGFNDDVIRIHTASKTLRKTIQEINEEAGKEMLESCFNGEMPEILMSKKRSIQLKKCIVNMKNACARHSICTHKLTNEDEDEIMLTLKKNGLTNAESSRVKVIFHPQFLSPTSPLLPIDYDDFTAGCHLGVFPSYYEPWGYTPAECLLNGIANITTNLSGFGSFIQQRVPDVSNHGVFIVDRRNKPREDSINQLTNYMLGFCMLSNGERTLLREKTKKLCKLLDWNVLGEKYKEARLLALDRLKEKKEHGPSLAPKGSQKQSRPLKTS